MNVSKIIAAIPAKSEAERRQIRTNAERYLAGGTDDEKAAAQSVIAALDQQEATEHKALYDRLSGKDRAERVVEAFRAIPPTDTDSKVIWALLENPNSTSTELSQACAWGSMTWQMHFGMMCEKREVYLWPAERFEKRDASFYSGILADFDQETSRFTMKPDVAEAFAALGLGKRNKP